MTERVRGDGDRLVLFGVETRTLFGQPCAIGPKTFGFSFGLLKGGGKTIAFSASIRKGRRVSVRGSTRTDSFLNGGERHDAVATAEGDGTQAYVDGAAIWTHQGVFDVRGLPEADAASRVHERRPLRDGQEVHERVPDHMLAASAKQGEAGLVHGGQHAVRPDDARHGRLELEDRAKPVLALSTCAERGLQVVAGAHLRERRQELKHEVWRLHHAVAHRQVTDSCGHIVAARPCEQHGGKIDLAGLQLTEEPDDVEPVETRVDDQQIRSKPAGSKALQRLLRVPWRDRDVGSASRQCLLRGCWIADPDHVDMFRTSVRLLGHLRCRASFRSIEPIA